MAESVALLLLLLGAVFMLLAAIGMVRMPDVLTRMHSSTKSGTLGVGLIMLGVALVFGDFAIARDLPAFKTTSIQFTPDKAGEFTFTCGMNMMRGKIVVSET